MDESSQKKNKTLEAIVAAVNLAAMGSALGKISADDAGKVERKLDELDAKIERIAEQIKSLQSPHQEQKLVVEAAGGGSAEKKPEGAQQSKPQDVIYVRKSSEFQFYT